MKRIIIAGLHHESNTFNPIIAEEKDFSLIVGDDIFNHLRDNDTITGIIETLRKENHIILPTAFARAVPNGVVDYNFYKKVEKIIFDKIKTYKKEGKIDGIILSLHGSMRVEKIGEIEGYFLEKIRNEFPNIPIVSSLDMHTTMTPKMHSNCDGFVGYKCAPHTDCTQTGIHAAKMGLLAIKEKVNLKSAWIRVPFIVAGEKSSTLNEPMITLIKKLREIEKEEKVLAASYLMGFPWADNEYATISCYVVTDSDQKLAEEKAKILSNLIWDKRKEFVFQKEAYTPKGSLDRAYELVSQGQSPVYISDSGDNPTAGASSDSTNFLKEILKDDRRLELKEAILYGGIYDPIATKICEENIGKEIELTFGAAFDKENSTPITLKGTVKSYIKDWSKDGMIKGDLALFSSSNVDIVISKSHVGYVTPELFIDLGADPKERQIVVCKLGYLTYKQSLVAKKSIFAITKGNTFQELETLNYKNIIRPVYPIDKEFSYDPEEYLIKK